jgi:hypothetical protein
MFLSRLEKKLRIDYTVFARINLLLSKYFF